MHYSNIDKQRTLANSFSLTGKGLHTGMVSTVTFLPAAENTGYKIRRVDLPGEPTIDAIAKNVANTTRSTVLSDKGVDVATVEHALAALYANEIDNCLIEVDAPEFPILDGSSLLYVDKILSVGAVEQNAVREYFTPETTIEYYDEATGSRMLLSPADSLSIHTQISFDSVILNVQSANLEDITEFNEKFSMCRTFVFVNEIEALIKHGLIKGGDLDNAIVIYDQPLPQSEFDQIAEIMKVEKRDANKLGYLMNEPLRFKNEPARHKILDIMGDIALTGRFIKGTIISVRPGHKANNMFARRIVEEMEKANHLQPMEYINI